MKNQIKFIKLLVILALALAVLGPVSVSAQGGNPPDLKDGGPGGNTGFGAALPSSPDDNCSAGPNLIQYDDGTIDASAGVTTADPASEIVQLFTPPGYPYTITKVCVTWAASVALATHPYEVVIYADTGAGPGAQLAAIPDLAGSVPVNPTTRWYGSAANYTVTSGSVYVGVRWVEASPPDQAVGYDSNGATPNQTIYYRYSAIPWTNATG
ncbi:MAG: hypothetical protein JXQ72_12055, partial [Anaerolineae bacterium]|nr:hypothetical protein [Anaerolineae bacterium]